MKAIFKVAPWVLGLGLLASAGTVRAQTGQSQFGAPSDKELVYAHTVALAPKLREIILRVQPQAKFEFGANTWRASYRSPHAATHLVDERGNLLKSGGEFPADFAEFSLELVQDTDIMYYRPNEPDADTDLLFFLPHVTKENPHYQVESFGKTLTTRAHLRPYIPSLVDPLGDGYPRVALTVPLDHWSYEALSQLAQEGLVDGGTAKKLKNRQPLRRGEFSDATIQIWRNIEQKKQKTALSEELMTALTDLESEFVEVVMFDEDGKRPVKREFTRKPLVRGMSYVNRYRFLSLRFSYGKGVPAAFVEEIRRTIKEYADRKSRGKGSRLLTH